MPHLGALTPEAEDNCAIMAVKQLRAFLEKGEIKNSVNYPKCKMDNPIPAGGTRLCICHKNIPGMISQYTSVLGNANFNIDGMIDQNKNDSAYSLIDIEGKIDDVTLSKLSEIEGVINVRPIFA